MAHFLSANADRLANAKAVTKTNNTLENKPNLRPKTFNIHCACFNNKLTSNVRMRGRTELPY